MAEGDIRRGFLEVEPGLLSWILDMSRTKPPMRMSAVGDSWHWEGGGDTPFVHAAMKLTEEASPPRRVRWWANVLRSGAYYKPHKHDGKWAFVYHLTKGAAVHFEGRGKFEATPGQILVFDSKLLHWTDKADGEPRVSIAGNLYFRAR